MNETHPFYETDNYAYSKPNIAGKIKQLPADFIVKESLGFTPIGEGEHVYCYLQKTGLDTEQVAKQLARFAQIPIRNVSFAGMKDRHAITEQWFSLHIPGKNTPNLSALNNAQIKILEQARHNKKLQRGSLKGNHFEIIIKELDGDKDQIEQRLALLQQGVPNYFGEQRFGRQRQNLFKATELLQKQLSVKKHLRGIYYSAIRSWLYNQQLSAKIADGSWNALYPGEVVNLVDSQSLFCCEQIDDGLIQRLKDQDIAPVSWLWGKGRDSRFESSQQKSYQLLAEHHDLLQLLEKNDLKMMARSNICYVRSLRYAWQENALHLQFYLSKGSYATSVLRELINF